MTNIKIYARKCLFSPIVDIILESPNTDEYYLMIAFAISLIDRAKEFKGMILGTEPNWNQKKEEGTRIVVFFKLIFKSSKNLEEFLDYLNS